MSSPVAVHEQVAPGWYGADPANTDLKPNPHGYYRTLRETQPVNLTPAGDWRLSRYSDVQKLLKHSHSGMRDMEGLIPGETRAETQASKFMLRADPPDHDRLRNLVSKAFTPRSLNAMRPAIEPLVNGELERVAVAGEMDLVADLALAVPAASMCAMLGVPFEDRHKLTELVSLVLRLIEERRSKPSGDILGQLVAAEESGDSLSTDELLQQSIGLLVAGLETTIGLISNGMVCFSRYPGEFEKLAANPALAGSAVEECLRFEPSVPITRRVLWEDTEFSGITIPANSIVYAILIAANRDPEYFSDPDRFDITRNGAKHCSFGGGIHFCLGSHLARMNAEIALTQMASRFTAIEVNEADIEWAPSLFRIPGKIPARFQMRARSHSGK